MAGMESMSNIKNYYQAACLDELPEFIARFRDDERAGVQKLVASAEKKLENLQKEKERIYLLQEFERKYSDYSFICGIDEVGRGPLAGPVFAAAVIMPEGLLIDGVNDSKKLTPKKREKLYDVICKEGILLNKDSNIKFNESSNDLDSTSSSL